MKTIEIHTDMIQLDQLLKWAGIVNSGGQVKYMIEDGVLFLNGVRVVERRKKVFVDDILEIRGTDTFKVIKTQGE